MTRLILLSICFFAVIPSLQGQSLPDTTARVQNSLDEPSIVDNIIKIPTAWSRTTLFSLESIIIGQDSPRIMLGSASAIAAIMYRLKYFTPYQTPSHTTPFEILLRNDKLRNEDRSLGRKILRAEGWVHGTQAVGLGILLLLPPEYTHWSANTLLTTARENLKIAWTKSPVWDHDDWFINYISHPYSGSLYYNSMRSQGASAFVSFMFSNLNSFFWEFVTEAAFERPSIQDLLFTSTIGSIIGEATHRAALKMSRNGFSTKEKIILCIINPLYVLNNGFKKRHNRPLNFK